MIRATATVVLHNFSMYANAAAKGNAVLGVCVDFCV